MVVTEVVWWLYRSKINGMIHDEMRNVEVLVELKWGMISSLFNALLLMAEILHQLRLVVCPIGL